MPSYCDCDDTNLPPLCGGRLWVPAAVALHAIEGDVQAVTATFVQPNQEGGPEGQLEMTVTGRRDAVADFVRTGALYYETFFTLAESSTEVDGRLVTVKLGRNAERLESVVDQQLDSESDPDLEPGARAFQVTSNVTGEGFDIWSVAANLYDVPPTDVAAPMTMSARHGEFAIAGYYLGSETDCWSVISRKVLDVQVNTRRSSIRWTGGGSATDSDGRVSVERASACFTRGYSPNGVAITYQIWR